ncbi:MAG: hypothetical protein ACXACK_16540 [Candidatus Hodarchaeales archaeon]
MSSKHFKFIMATALILLIVSTIPRVSATTVWTENFEDGNLNDWDLFGTSTNVLDDIMTRHNVSEFSVVDGALTAPNSQNWGQVSEASHNSTVAYGTWSFDWVVAEGTIHKVYDEILFIYTDREHNYDATGVTTSDFLEGISGYGLILSSSKYPYGDDIAGPGLTLLEYTNQKELVEFHGKHQFGTNLVGTYQIDITRDSQGNFKIYFDSVLYIQATDNSTTTSEKFNFLSFRGDSQIDNITVSDSVDVSYPAPASITVSVVVLGLLILPLVVRKRKK